MSSVSCGLTMASNVPTITLGGGFSTINGMVFLGKSEEKGKRLYKCKRLFNVREIQKPGENFVITARILKSTSVKETWNLRFEVDPVTRKVIRACCSCVVGSMGRCKHSSALFHYINFERPDGKTDKEQLWTTPSQKAEERFPKGQTVKQIFGATDAPNSSSVVIQKEEPDFCNTLKADLERFGLQSSSLFKSLAVEPVVEDEEPAIMPSDLNLQIQKIFHYGVMLLPQQCSPQMGPEETIFYQKLISTSDDKRESIFCQTIGQFRKKKWEDETIHTVFFSEIIYSLFLKPYPFTCEFCLFHFQLS